MSEYIHERLDTNKIDGRARECDFQFYRAVEAMHYKSVRELSEEELERRAEDFSVHPHVTEDDVTKLKEELKSFKEATKNYPVSTAEIDHLNLHFRARRDRPAMWKMALKNMRTKAGGFLYSSRP